MCQAPLPGWLFPVEGSAPLPRAVIYSRITLGAVRRYQLLLTLNLLRRRPLQYKQKEPRLAQDLT